MRPWIDLSVDWYDEIKSLIKLDGSWVDSIKLFVGIGFRFGFGCVIGVSLSLCLSLF